MHNFVALDRDALYYPYIHVHDVNWLKSTLLCFPSVHRILPDAYVPQGFTSDDSEEIKQYCKIKGARGPLLQPSKSVHGAAPADAANELQRNIQANEDFFIRKYSRAATLAEFGEQTDGFKLHDSKVSYNLIHYLEGKELAWRGPNWEWIIMHPRLGTAIMSTISLAIAQSDGLDIITPSDRAHYVTSFSDGSEVFANLLNDDNTSAAPKREDLTEDLAQLVMTTLFDVSRLTADQIAGLQKDGKDLRKFKNSLVSIAAQIPDIPNPEARLMRLQEASEPSHRGMECVQERSSPLCSGSTD